MPDSRQYIRTFTTIMSPPVKWIATVIWNANSNANYHGVSVNTLWVSIDPDQCVNSNDEYAIRILWCIKKRPRLGVRIKRRRPSINSSSDCLVLSCRYRFCVFFWSFLFLLAINYLLENVCVWICKWTLRDARASRCKNIADAEGRSGIGRTSGNSRNLTRRLDRHHSVTIHN